MSSDVIPDVSSESLDIGPEILSKSLLSLPDDALSCIISYLTLKDRCNCSKVCHRLNNVLFLRSNGLVDVAVLNIFEKTVWDKNIHNQADSRIESVVLKKFDDLSFVLRHIVHVNSVKLWLQNHKFVDIILNVVKDSGLHFKCLDVYPYSEQDSLKNVYQIMPQLQALTLRPHSSDYFWNGYPLDLFPNFSELDTLILDGVNLSPFAILPPSITQLEWTNRKDEAFEIFITHLNCLPKLQYLQIAHTDFTKVDLFRKFLETVRNMKNLMYLVFRFIKFPLIDFGDLLVDANEEHVKNDLPLSGIKVIKFDMCYGNVSHYVTEIVGLTSKSLKILSLHLVVEDLAICQLRAIVPLLKSRDISIQFGLLQKGPSLAKTRAARLPDEENNDNNVPNDVDPIEVGRHVNPPIALRDVLWKVDLSFVENTELLSGLFSLGIYGHLVEIKFVQCKGLTNDVILSVAMSCPHLKKLMVADCSELTEDFLMHFLNEWTSRKTDKLTICWKQKNKHPASFYLDLKFKHKQILDNHKLYTRFVQKDAKEGEKILIWDKNDIQPKLMVIKNYSESELHQYLGFTVDIN